MQTIDVRGQMVPGLGFGTWQMHGDTCRRSVERALEVGYRHIDTAQMYENEAEVGAALESSGVARDDVFVTTKAWPDDLVEDSACVDASLDRLRTDHVDLLLIHWPSPTRSVPETLEPLVAAAESGKARLIGVSNFPPGMLREALSRAPIACNQVEYHPYLDQAGLLRIAREEDLLFTAYCPLARGDAAADPVLGAIGERHGKSAAQVALRWLLQQERVAAVPKAARPEHVETNFDVFDFELSDDEMREVHALARGKRYIDPGFAPDWNA